MFKFVSLADKVEALASLDGAGGGRDDSYTRIKKAEESSESRRDSEKSMDNRERDSQSQGHEANLEKPSIFHGARRVGELERSTITMALHCVSMQEAVISHVENRAVDREDGQRNWRSVSEKLVE
jgi:hypothetical protein